MVLSLGYGGQKVIHAVTGLSPDTLQLGVAQLQGTASLDPDRIRRQGGRRKHARRSGIAPALDHEKFRSFSPRLNRPGHAISRMTVSQLLAKNHYSMQANRKRFESGSHHPDRDGPFAHIAEMTRQFQGLGNAEVISVDAKKKEDWAL